MKNFFIMQIMRRNICAAVYGRRFSQNFFSLKNCEKVRLNEKKKKI